MNSKEAIERLKEGAPFSALYDETYEEAIALAIKALEAEPVVPVVMYKEGRTMGGHLNKARMIMYTDYITCEVLTAHGWQWREMADNAQREEE